MESAPVAPWPHQRIVARRLVESYPKAFLCDEVRLGKTMRPAAFRSLLLSGVVRRILIAPPRAGSSWLRWRRSSSPSASSCRLSLRGTRPLPRAPPTAEGFCRPTCARPTGLLVRKERLEIGRAESFDIARGRGSRRLADNSSAETGRVTR